MAYSVAMNAIFSRLPRVARIVVMVGLSLAIAAILAWASMWLFPAPSQQDQSPVAVAAQSAFVGAPFSLVDHQGKPVTEASWPNQYRLIYFGFTHCPDICPTGLQALSHALARVPDDVAAKIQPIFVTVDPARDTAAVLSGYVGLFSPGLVGLTGTAEQIAAMLRAYKVYAQKRPSASGDPSGYMMDHSSFTYLMTPDNRLAELFPHNTSPEVMAAGLMTVVKP
jgi:protein SCO1/2